MPAAKRKFYKTTVTVEVLHEGPLNINSLEELSYAITDGDCSGDVQIKQAKKMTPKAFAKECFKQGSDPEFFQIDSNGKDLEQD